MKITWREVALDGLESARRYIAQHNPMAAERVFATILAAIRRLPDMPYIGRPGRVPGTRELVVTRTRYIVAYRVAGDTIEILAVLHGARQWPKSFD